jgi:hypothetical protein
MRRSSPTPPSSVSIAAGRDDAAEQLIELDQRGVVELFGRQRCIARAGHQQIAVDDPRCHAAIIADQRIVSTFAEQFVGTTARRHLAHEPIEVHQRFEERAVVARLRANATGPSAPCLA